MVAAGLIDEDFLTLMGYNVPVQRVGILSLLQRIIDEDSNAEIPQDNYVGSGMW